MQSPHFIADPNCMANPSPSIIAAFDFDGTLTYRDSFLPFLNFVVGSTLKRKNLCLESFHFFQYLLGYLSRQQLKEALLTRFLKGKGRREMKMYAERYAKEFLPTLLRPQAIDRIRWHKNQGHRCVLISANLDIYLKPWGQAVGFDNIIASRVAFSPQGYLTGCLQGLNCRGAEKVRRLIEEEGPTKNYILYAYGDSQGDRELLQCANFSFYRRLN